MVWDPIVTSNIQIIYWGHLQLIACEHAIAQARCLLRGQMMLLLRTSSACGSISLICVQVFKIYMSALLSEDKIFEKNSAQSPLTKYDSPVNYIQQLCGSIKFPRVVVLLSFQSEGLLYLPW